MKGEDFAREASAAFRKMIARPEFSCLGAKAALNDNACTVASYKQMADARSTSELARDLGAFARSEILTRSDYASFIAVFQAPVGLTESEFEELLWKQLRDLHALDRSNWDTGVSSDPADPHFSFSFAGQAFYVLGMHANSSRISRRFPWPALAFNPHAQFERLRSDGKWKRMQHSIRAREIARQGEVNPMLSDFGEASEARQYSGRAVDGEWKCPFAH